MVGSREEHWDRMRHREKLFRQIDEVREGNRGADPEQVEADIEEAVAAVRAARHRTRGAGGLPESQSGSRRD